MSYNYRVYGKRKIGGYEHIGTVKTLENAYTMGNKLSGNDYYNYLLIRHDIELNIDMPIDIVFLERTKVKEKVKHKKGGEWDVNDYSDCS